MKLRKWNYKTKTYKFVVVPDGNYKVYSDDMDEIVNCPHCHKEFKFGNGYTSRVFHNEYGLAYAVCPECYKKEMEIEIERKYRNEEK